MRKWFIRKGTCNFKDELEWDVDTNTHHKCSFGDDFYDVVLNEDTMEGTTEVVSVEDVKRKLEDCFIVRDTRPKEEHGQVWDDLRALYKELENASEDRRLDKFKSVEESKKSVDVLSTTLWGNIKTHLKTLHPEDRWLVMTRSVNAIFSHVFGISMQFSSEREQDTKKVNFSEERHEL